MKISIFKIKRHHSLMYLNSYLEGWTSENIVYSVRTFERGTFLGACILNVLFYECKHFHTDFFLPVNYYFLLPISRASIVFG